VSAPQRRGVGFWLGLVVGWATMGFGLAGLLSEADDTRPGDLARWFLGGAVAHDALAAPVVCGAGWLLARAVPRSVRAPVAGGLVVTAAVVLYGWPFLRGYGLSPDNPSALPLDYAAGLATVLAAVWLVSGGLAWRCWRRAGPSS
jgi:hypothetical protein